MGQLHQSQPNEGQAVWGARHHSESHSSPPLAKFHRVMLDAPPETARPESTAKRALIIHYDWLSPWKSRKDAGAKVIKKIASLLLGLWSVSQPADAQTAKGPPPDRDRWMLYERATPDGMPLIVLARTGNTKAQALLLDGRATAVVCLADPANVNSRGMPQNTDRLYPMEDRLDTEPALRAAGAILIASVTGQGQRRTIMLHRDPIDFLRILQAISVQGFTCAASEVTDRKVLIDLVTPSPLDIQLNGDRDVIGSLNKQGDDGHRPRKTDFWFYGQRGSLEALSANLQAHGFNVDHWLHDPTGLVLSRKMPVDWAAFQELTPVIVGAAAQSKVDYDGWETMVVSSDAISADGGKKH